ncbi:evC complex member EVC isoform X2 [Triplophysa rosa]|uniref:evC complex member EVC isoform X2 n=1 Tax=Triplophysa rosa TaxID=992332 RepID=UPI0025460489|nr:evC complex member EVC isoform X2 [Triplophysa rosa]
MRFNASSGACSSDVLIELTESLRVRSAPVTGAAVSGVGVAVVAAALIYMCYRKRVIITAPLQGARRRLEVCEHNSERESESRRSQHKTEPDKVDDPQLTVNSDVAAFALKARVVYPISQRFRPLADGASNPSLHEKCRNQDSSSSSADDWLSREREDDESSQFMSCTLNNTQTSRPFRRVQHYPQTLAHSRSSLLCLTLQELHLYTSQLQQEKYKVFLEILPVLLGDREHADIIHTQQQQFSFTQHAFVQEGEVLKREMMREDERQESDTLLCSIEEMEKTGRQKLTRSLQTALRFGKQLERLRQSLHSRFSRDDAQEVTRALLRGLRLVETVLAEIQSSVLKTLMDRLEWWEEVADWLREKSALLKKEAELVVKLTGQSVERLRPDGQREELLSEFQRRVNEELQQWMDEMGRQTDELTHKHCEKVCVRRKRMMKTRSSDTHTDIQRLLDAQVTHWNQWRDFELQQDARITDALCERWRSLCDKCSRRLTDLSTECVESNIPASTDICQSVLKTMKLTVTNQIRQEERHAHTHLQMLREQLQRCRQVWIEEEALTLCCLNHFGEQQRKIVMEMVSRHSDISCDLIEEQQRLLVLEFQRILAARYFCLRTVREMHSDAQDPCVAVETLPCEAAQNLHHEQLSELEAAADMLQEHAHVLFGHALARTTRLQMSCLSAGGTVRTDRCVKEGLIDAVCESVFVTRDSVLSLIREYYTHIQHIAMTTLQQLRPHTSATERRSGTRALHTQLNNCARKLNSTESLHRIVEIKTKCLSEFENKHHNPVRTRGYRQELADEEKTFMCRLAALARVSLDSISTEYLTGADVRERNLQTVM